MKWFDNRIILLFIRMAINERKAFIASFAVHSQKPKVLVKRYSTPFPVRLIPASGTAHSASGYA